MKIVKVLWIDSCNSNMNWTVAEDIEVEPIYINSFGVVVKDTDEFLAIAQNYGNDPEQYSNITTIPKGCIKEVFVIHKDNKYENEQKSSWSEEDENMLKMVIKSCEQCGNEYAYYWLKSLKDRIGCKTNCTTMWKPSEEQMNALRYVTNFDYGGYKATLVSLYEQLKKLKD